MIKSFNEFIGESGDQFNDLKTLFDLGMISRREYSMEMIAGGQVPEGYRRVKMGFEFDWHWADQHYSDEAIDLITKRYVEDESVPTDCFVIPDSIYVDEMGWSLDAEEDEDGWTEPHYGNRAFGSMEMMVPDGVTDQDLSVWVEYQTSREISDFYLEKSEES